MHIALVPMLLADQDGNPVRLSQGEPVPAWVSADVIKGWVAEGAVSKRKRKPAAATADAVVMTADLTVTPKEDR